MKKSTQAEAKTKANLVEFLGGPEIFSAYENASSHEERVKIVYYSPMIQSLFKTQLQTFKDKDFALKSDRESKRLRDLGNKAFAGKRDQKALELYTEALTYADPLGEGDAYALALANRSAVHLRFAGAQWKKRALVDIERALRSGHPAPAKLLERKATCLQQLGRHSEAKEVIIELLSDKALPQEKMTALEAKMKELENGENDCTDTKRIGDEEEQKVVIFDPHPQYPSLSSAIQIRYETERGRFGIARRDIKAGETLVFENPTGAVIKRTYQKDHCIHCFKKISGFQIPCLRCTDAQFCSETCLNEANETYHKYECAFYTRNVTNFFADFLKKFKGESGVFGYYQLLYKLLTKKDLNFFKTYHQDFVKNPNEKFAPENAKIGKCKTQPLTNPSEVNEENKKCFYGGSYRGLFSLVRHSYDDTGCSIFWVILSAVFHLRTLQLTGYFGAEKRSYDLTPDELLVAGVLVDMLQLLRYNTHAIIEHFNLDPPTDDGQIQVWRQWKNHPIGTAIYPALALLNHSCDPNIIKYFRGPTVVAVASRAILAGEEVCENYYPAFTHIDTITRKKWLLKHYCFDCRCTPCELNYKLRPDCESFMTNLKWKCSKCFGCLELSPNGTCNKCGVKTSSSFSELGEKCSELMDATEVLKKNVANLQLDDMAGLQKIYQEFCKIHTQLTTILQPDSKEVLESNDFFHALLSKLSEN